MYKHISDLGEEKKKVFFMSVDDLWAPKKSNKVVLTVQTEVRSHSGPSDSHWRLTWAGTKRSVADEKHKNLQWPCSPNSEKMVIALKRVNKSPA